MARPTTIPNSLVVSTRFASDEYKQLQEIAALESNYSGKVITAGELIRNACKFCYGNGERLREMFRISREGANKRTRRV